MCVLQELPKNISKLGNIQVIMDPRQLTVCSLIMHSLNISSKYKIVKLGFTCGNIIYVTESLIVLNPTEN